MQEDEIKQLQDAVRQSPENLPLRRLLAAALLRGRRFAEAEAEFKDALRLAPADPALKIGLAEAFHGQDKISLGLVIIEELVQQATPPPRAWLVYARLLLKGNQAAEALEAYENALALDENLRDNFLESEINLQIQAGSRAEPEKIKLSAGPGEDGEDHLIEVERPKVTFGEVGGMDHVKDQIRMKIIHPLEHPDIYKAYGKKIGGGILLYGPPGCGKTHIARATAGQIHANFIAVGISDILDMYLGQSERNLHAIFQQARITKPCVLFFDEVDALGASRSDMRHSAGRMLINQFLDELDGLTYDNEGVLILAATNAPWHLDAAFRRPGRFDRIIFVPPPDEAAREAILRIKLRGKPTAELDLGRLARKTEGFSGADIEAVVDMAIESKLDEAIRRGAPQPIGMSELEDAARKHRSTIKEWFSTAKNYALFANEGGLYDDILDYLKLKR